MYNVHTEVSFIRLSMSTGPMSAGVDISFFLFLEILIGLTLGTFSVVVVVSLYHHSMKCFQEARIHAFHTE